MKAPPRRFLVPAALGVVVAAASSVVPLSYDEGNWIAVTRRVAAGESLYREITDNKTPALFGLVRSLDVLPGRFALARALWLGILAATVAVAVTSLARRFGWAENRASLLGGACGLALALQAVLVVNFEAPAAAMIIVALASLAAGRAPTAGILAAAATAFDLRAIILIPGVLIAAYEIGGKRTALRTAAPAVGLAGAWVATVLSVPDLRYSLLELNVATRSGSSLWRPASQLYALLRGTLFAAGAAASLARSGGSSNVGGWHVKYGGVALIGGGVVVALSSVQPFDKYWSLALPGIALAAASRPPSPRSVNVYRRNAAVILAILGLVLTSSYAAASNIDQARLVARYERASARLDRSLAPRASFVRFDTQPFLGTFLAQRDRIPAAVLDFLIHDTSRREMNFARVDAAIGRADALVDDGALDQPESSIVAVYRPLWRVFARRVQEFPCVRRVRGLTFRYRAGTCPPTERSR